MSHCGRSLRSRYDQATEPLDVKAERGPGFYYFITESWVGFCQQQRRVASRLLLGTRCRMSPRLSAAGAHGVAFPSIVLRCRVTPPFAELRQMLLVDAIDLGLHLGMNSLRSSSVASIAVWPRPPQG